MEHIPSSWWVILAALFSTMSCALLGCFLVLRRLSLLGDAVSHAILPGLALAFLFTGSRSVFPMFIGASIFGILTAFLSQSLVRRGRVEESASMGVVFTTFFALGVILIRQAADKIDLDPGCVLYGLLELVPLDTISIFGSEIPRAVIILGGTFLGTLTFIGLFYKELKIVSFDPALATALGFRAELLHYLLMVIVALVSVASFEAVGSILVVAMLIVPGATARLLTDRLSLTLLISIIVSAISAFFGYELAAYFNTSVAGMIASVSGLLFFFAVLFAPYGLLAQAMNSVLLRLRIISEDILGLIYRCQEEHYRQAFPLSSRNIVAAMGGGIGPYVSLLLLPFQGLLWRDPTNIYQLTAHGEKKAREIIRTHRLWETYLVKHLKLRDDHVHGTATALEHHTTEKMQEELAEKVEGAKADPHGKEIPVK